jgi:hypothetical protein
MCLFWGRPVQRRVHYTKRRAGPLIFQHTDSNELGWPMWLSCRWRSPFQLLAIGSMQFYFVELALTDVTNYEVFFQIVSLSHYSRDTLKIENHLTNYTHENLLCA